MVRGPQLLSGEPVHAIAPSGSVPRLLLKDKWGLGILSSYILNPSGGATYRASISSWYF